MENTRPLAAGRRIAGNIESWEIGEDRALERARPKADSITLNRDAVLSEGAAVETSDPVQPVGRLTNGSA